MAMDGRGRGHPRLGTERFHWKLANEGHPTSNGVNKLDEHVSAITLVPHPTLATLGFFFYGKAKRKLDPRLNPLNDASARTNQGR
jgi:hypothetical protein